MIKLTESEQMRQLIDSTKVLTESGNESTEITYELVDDSFGWSPDVIMDIASDTEEKYNFETADMYEDDDYNIVIVASKKEHAILQQEFKNFEAEQKSEGHDVSIKAKDGSASAPERSLQLAKILEYILHGSKPDSDSKRYKSAAINYKRSKLEYKAVPNGIHIQDSNTYGNANTKKDATLIDMMKNLSITNSTELGLELESAFGAQKNPKITK